MSAREFIPERKSLTALRDAAAGCRGCHLHEHATQTVFGEGPKSARIMLGAIVRQRDSAAREAERQALADDLRTVLEAV